MPFFPFLGDEDDDGELGVNSKPSPKLIELEADEAAFCATGIAEATGGATGGVCENAGLDLGATGGTDCEEPTLAASPE